MDIPSAAQTDPSFFAPQAQTDMKDDVKTPKNDSIFVEEDTSTDTETQEGNDTSLYTISEPQGGWTDCLERLNEYREQIRKQEATPAGKDNNELNYAYVIEEIAAELDTAKAELNTANEALKSNIDSSFKKLG